MSYSKESHLYLSLQGLTQSMLEQTCFTNLLWQIKEEFSLNNSQPFQGLNLLFSHLKVTTRDTKLINLLSWTVRANLAWTSFPSKVQTWEAAVDMTDLLWGKGEWKTMERWCRDWCSWAWQVCQVQENEYE